jgi:hypothetical protein
MASNTKDVNPDEGFEYVLLSDGSELRVKKGICKVGDEISWELPDPYFNDNKPKTQKQPPPQLPDGMKRDEWISLDKK